MSDRRKSRRSSILKPPKPRNPLSDVDLNPPSVDVTFMKSRRVSFANSNFIKEFTADPEKNTIWHNSYEEVVNKSEDSKNSEHQINAPVLKVECLDNSFETPLLNSPLEMSICSSNIDLTAGLSENDAALVHAPAANVLPDEIPFQKDRNMFMPHHQYSTVFDQLPRNMEITGSIPVNSNLMKNIIKNRQSTSTTINKENQMYYDYNVIVKNETRTNVTTNYSNCNLDFTQTVSQQIDNSNESMSECSMEITQTIPTSIATNTTIPDMEMTQFIPTNIKLMNKLEDNTKSTSTRAVADMEFTQALPIHLHSFINKPQIGDDMELTTVLPATFELISNQTTNHKIDMEFTAAIPAGIKLVPNETIEDNKNENDMEFTQAIPSGLKYLINRENIVDDMEFTSAIPAGIKLVPNEDKEETKNENDMEFTQAIPNGFKYIINRENIDDDMEFTSAIPAGIKLVPNEAKEETKNENDMEFTQAIPSGLKYIINRENIVDDMEFTSAIPAGIKLVPNEDKEETKNENDMEFTQVIPSGLKYLIKRENIDDMEFTSAIPTGIKLVPNEAKEKNKNENDMEFSQAIPGTLNLMKNQLVDNMEFTQAIGDDMEMTSAIPAGLKLVPIEMKENNKNENIMAIPCLNKSFIPNELNMEFKAAIPAEIINTINEKSMDNDSSKLEDNMKLTTTHPVGINLTAQENKEGSVELIAATIPNNKKVTLNKTEDKTENENHMELTEAIPAALKLYNSTNTNDMEKTTVPLPLPSVLKLPNYSKKDDSIPNTSNTDIIQASTNRNTIETNDNEELNTSTSIIKDDKLELEETKCVSLNENESIINNADNNIVIKNEEIKTGNFANIFHVKGYPLILSPGTDENNRSDICLRIKYPDNEDAEDASINVSQIQMNLTSKLNCTKDLFNSSNINKSSFVDCTEKLINYQINYNNPSTNTNDTNEQVNKRRSSENISNISNIPLKIVASDQINISSSEYDNNVNDAWKSIVEKSYMKNDDLCSENVSLITSFDSGNTSSICSTEVDTLNWNNLPIIKYCEEIINQLKDTLKMTPNIIEYNDDDDDDNDKQMKCEELRKRFEESFKTQNIKELSLEEKIKQKSKDAIWNVVEINDFVYTFNFMFETIVLVVHVADDDTSGNVKKIEVYSQFCEETSKPAGKYVHYILRKKLTHNFIISALGRPYNILSLLDLITMIGEQMYNILWEFDDLECQYGLVLNNDLTAQIQFLDLYLPIAFEVTLNINNIENISKDDVKVKALVGKIDESAIEKLIEGCPQNIQLIRSFIVNVEGYIKFLKSIKHKKKLIAL